MSAVSRPSSLPPSTVDDAIKATVLLDFDQRKKIKTPGRDESPLCADQSRSSTVVDQKLVFCERKHWTCQPENNWTEIEMYIYKIIFSNKTFIFMLQMFRKEFLCILGSSGLHKQTKATCGVDYGCE